MRACVCCGVLRFFFFEFCVCVAACPRSHNSEAKSEEIAKPLEKRHERTFTRLRRKKRSSDAQREDSEAKGTSRYDPKLTTTESSVSVEWTVDGREKGRADDIIPRKDTGL